MQLYNVIIMLLFAAAIVEGALQSWPEFALILVGECWAGQRVWGVMRQLGPVGVSLRSGGGCSTSPRRWRLGLIGKGVRYGIQPTVRGT